MSQIKIKFPIISAIKHNALFHSQRLFEPPQFLCSSSNDAYSFSRMKIIMKILYTTFEIFRKLAAEADFILKASGAHCWFPECRWELPRFERLLFRWISPVLGMFGVLEARLRIVSSKKYSNLSWLKYAGFSQTKLTAPKKTEKSTKKKEIKLNEQTLPLTTVIKGNKSQPGR